ncbi:MAG: hypothetical protein LQ346_002675 [Caloplaca aetnensis]|nr:MAG: hypothetical protein LQ346_002675 [Caloplaca aetnensis]
MLALNSSGILFLAMAAVVLPRVGAAGPMAPLPLLQSVRNDTLRLHPMPNPYPMPGTNLSIFFHQVPLRLAPSDATDCINHARRQVTWHIGQFGNQFLPRRIFYRCRTIGFEIEAVQPPPERRLTYSDTIAILAAYARRIGQNGSFLCFAQVLVTETGEVIGEALLSPLQNGISAIERRPKSAEFPKIE